MRLYTRMQPQPMAWTLAPARRLASEDHLRALLESLASGDRSALEALHTLERHGAERGADDRPRWSWLAPDLTELRQASLLDPAIEEALW